MEPSLELFEAHADEVFVSYMLEGQSRQKAIASTEAFFLGHINEPVERVEKIPYTQGYFGFAKHLVKLPS